MRRKETKRQRAFRKQRSLRVARSLAKLFPRARVFLAYRTPWELLVAVMLSAQCTDLQVNKVTEALFKKYPTFKDYLRVSRAQFERDIHSTGFYRTKAKHILEAAKIIHARFEDAVPSTIEELIALPGVGRKTANIVLANAYGKVVGIPVDTHVRRLAQKLGLSDENDPNKIEQDLVRLLPKKEWGHISYRLIEYGRRYCPARKHDHAHCPLSRVK